MSTARPSEGTRPCPPCSDTAREPSPAPRPTGPASCARPTGALPRGLARINLWTFALPPLRERPEDLEPNLDYELARFEARSARLVRFSTEARARYIAFATGPGAEWPGNFRDLSASVARMATLAPGGRIDTATVDREVEKLSRAWARPAALEPADPLGRFLSSGELEGLDRFDRVQLAEVVRVCLASATASEAGRELFAASRARRASVNDADRLRKYLARFGLTWARLHGNATVRERGL